MSARAAEDSTVHLTLRIPGWLLALGLVVVVAWFGGRCVAGVVEQSTGAERAGFSFPYRFTALQADFEDRAFSATVLIESNSEIDSARLTYSVRLDDGTQLTASATFLRPGAWHGRSRVVEIEKVLPEGRTPESIVIVTPTSHSSVDISGALSR